MIRKISVFLFFLFLVSLVFGFDVPAAAVASEETITIVSDTSWKWNKTELPDWTSGEFNDSAWQLTAAPSEGLCGPAGNPNPHIADPMWATELFHSIIYFRKQFTLDQLPKSATIQTVFDDDGDIYINGTLVR